MADDYYATLGIDRKASADEIKRAYRRLTLLNHPDRNPDDPQAPERYRRINLAYAVLGDAAARARYDVNARLGAGLDLTRGFETTRARDLLANVFGDVFRSRRGERRRGRDLKYTLSVSLAEAVLGSSHTIEFEAPGPCTTCSGTGVRPGGAAPTACSLCGGRGELKGDGLFARWSTCGRCEGMGLVHADPCESCRGSGKRRQARSFEVRLPEGTDSGATKLLAGQGEPGRFGGESGDLKVTINVRPDRWLRREGGEIRCEVPISITEATLGARVPVPTVDGVAVVDVPAGVRSGTKLRLRRKGVPQAKSGRGDQLVTVVVETPRGAARAGDPEPPWVELLRALERETASGDMLPQRAEQRTVVLHEDSPSNPTAGESFDPGRQTAGGEVESG